MDRLVSARGLSARDLQDIRRLEAACCRIEPLNLKLNWDMLENRSTSETSDFLYYEGEGLIGFLGLYGFGSEIEMTGMVHPDHRRRGVFTQLLAAAEQECRTRNCSRMLLIAERSSGSGTAFVKHTGGRYAYSEYRMRFDQMTVPEFPRRGVALRRAEPKDAAELLQLDVECFGLRPSDEELSDRIHHDSIYFVELAGQAVGKIGVSKEGLESYIFGFAIRPEFRGRGLGREALSRVLTDLLSRGMASAILEVSVENERALSLYQSCGFETVTVYDYYDVGLQNEKAL